MRESLHLVLSLSKGEVGTRSMTDTDNLRSARCCEGA